MPRLITTAAVAAGFMTIVAATATTANAQILFPEPNAAMIHDAGASDRIGHLCWVDTDSYKEIDVHGYWRGCAPSPVRPAVFHHHRMSRMAR